MKEVKILSRLKPLKENSQESYAVHSDITVEKPNCMKLVAAVTSLSKKKL
jgi:hypothetical protein